MTAVRAYGEHLCATCGTSVMHTIGAGYPAWLSPLPHKSPCGVACINGTGMNEVAQADEHKYHCWMSCPVCEGGTPEMSAKKKAMRERFRNEVFGRDKSRCVLCMSEKGLVPPRDDLDAHHIMPRELMPNGGYAKENGISLCPTCHKRAEDALHGDVTARPQPSELYALIGSSYGEAVAASKRLVEVED